MSTAYRSRLLLAAEILLWTLGALCVSTYVYAQLSSEVTQREAIQAFRAHAGDADTSRWSESRIEHYNRALSAGDGQIPLGILSIPSIDLQVAVFDGTSARTLNLGVGRVSGTAVVNGDGNLALAGHRDGFFRGLKDLAIGDVLTLEGPDATTMYQVSDTFVVDPEEVFVLEPTPEPTLTLITCYPFYFVGHAPQRFIVRASRKN